VTSTADRLAAVLDHLGLERVLIATQMPGDIAGFCAKHPDRVAGLALVIASRITPSAFAPFGHKVMVLTGDSGIPSETAGATAPAMPDAARAVIEGYAATAWSNIAAERPDDLCNHLEHFLGAIDGASSPRPDVQAEGEIAGVTFRVSGTGPALILPPFFLAASQWEPVIERLSRRFTTVVLGGAHIGGVAMLEDRASLASYRDLFRAIIHRMDVPEGARVLEVGCGPAALCRQLLDARADIALTGLDANAYLLRDGADLARSKGLSVVHDTEPGAGQLRLVEGDATRLPFEDASFDAVHSITVLEECDADAALAEIVRVLRPGGVAGVAVRAIDMAQWWNLDLPDAIAAKVNTQPQSVSPGAVADRSLYPRMAAAGLGSVQGFPFMITFDRPDGPIWAYRAAHARGLLDEAERAVWDQAVASADAAGLLFQANPVHCAVGWR